MAENKYFNLFELIELPSTKQINSVTFLIAILTWL